MDEEIILIGLGSYLAQYSFDLINLNMQQKIHSNDFSPENSSIDDISVNILLQSSYDCSMQLNF